MLNENLQIIIVFLTIFLTSCQPENQRDESMQTLKIDFQEGDLPSLHPHDVVIYLRGLSIVKSLYEGLTRIDEHGQAVLSGARSLEVSTDRLRYTFTLRDNAWSDGTPVTAFHFENAWKEALSPTSTCPRSDLLYMIKNAKEAKTGLAPADSIGIKAVDAKTFVVELANPSPFFLELCAQPICAPLLHPQKKEMAEFNGPFMVSRWEKGHLLELKPNPHFWNRKNVLLSQIDIYMIQDTNTAYSFFKEGKIDYIGAPLCALTSEQIDRLKETKALKSCPIDRVLWIFLNTQHISLSSPLIRQALSMAIQRQSITNHIIMSGHPLFTPLPTTLLPLPTPIATKEDLTAARKLFDQGLTELGFTKDTLPPLIITYSQQANRKQLAEYLQERWSQAFGIKVQLESKDWTTLRTNLIKGLFDISFSYSAPYYKDPMELLDYLASINSCNFSQWVYPPFTKKIDIAKQEKEFQKRTIILGEAQQLLTEQMPIIPVCTDRIMFATHPKLQGYVYDCLGAIDFSYASFNQ
ncbi:MAG: bac 5 protein [Parachlamydiales bacterium]|nr:bac 5 protein [Parachlamydiales bacterium]